MQSCFFYDTINPTWQRFYFINCKKVIFNSSISILTNKKETYTIKQEHTFDGGCYEKG